MKRDAVVIFLAALFALMTTQVLPWHASLVQLEMFWLMEAAFLVLVKSETVRFVIWLMGRFKDAVFV